MLMSEESSAHKNPLSDVAMLSHFTYVYNIQSAPDFLNTDISNHLRYQIIYFGHSPDFYVHSNSCYLKILISQSKFSGTRKFTLRYQYFEMIIDFEISRADCAF